MGFSATSPAPEKGDPTAENRVWGFFGEAPEMSRRNRPQTLQPRQGNRPVTTRIASGRAYWPSRDPIGERGGTNLYGMVGNDAVNKLDILGMASYGFPPSRAASFMGYKCCCVGEPENCSIKVSWLKEGVILFGAAAAKPGKPAKRGDLAVQSQVYAKVELIHKEGKDIRGCTLIQDAITKSDDLGIDIRTMPDIIHPVYLGAYEDLPTISAKFNIVNPPLPQGRVTAYFRAVVRVAEEPKVKNAQWGFQIEASWDAPSNRLSAHFIKVVPEPEKKWKSQK
jgi:hypothetical protein